MWGLQTMININIVTEKYKTEVEQHGPLQKLKVGSGGLSWTILAFI